MSRRLWAAASLMCAALALAACGDMSRFQTASPVASPAAAATAKPNRTVAQTPAAEREHERILSSYGGAYDDPKLEALITQTVDRLVAASDAQRSLQHGPSFSSRSGPRWDCQHQG